MTGVYDSEPASPSSPEAGGGGGGGPHSQLRSSDSGGFETGGDSARGRKSKKAKKVPLSIEQVFNTPSTETSSNLNPPPARVVMTPRSAEVCLKLGVNPECLKIRDIDSFWEVGIDPAVQRMRHEVYVQRRHDLMKQCRHERRKLINAEFEQHERADRPARGLSPEQLIEEQKAQTSTLVALEMKRIEKMKKRQEKELEQMLQYEITRAQNQQEMEKRIQQGKKKEEMRKKQQEKRMKLMAEERRLREMQKIAQEEAEEEKSRQLAKIMFDREQQLIAEQKRRNEEKAEQLRREEEERRQKHEEHKMQTQRFFSEQEMILRKRLEDMHVAEEKKQAMILQSQREKKRELETKRRAVEERIERNMQMAVEVEEKRKRDFLEAQARSEALRAEHLAKMEEERELKAQEAILQEQRKRMILLQQMRAEEKKKQEMLRQFEEEEQHVQEVFEMRKRDLDLHNEKKKLNVQLKHDNVERVKRMGEYKRFNTLKKIEETDKRTKTLITNRLDLIKQRREAAAKTKLQKDAIAKVMDQVRTDASKANKIIKMVLSGKGTIAELTSVSPSPTRARSNSSGRRGSPGTNSMQMSHSGGGGMSFKHDDRHSQSAGATMGTTSNSFMRETNPAPQAYVSPYATVSGPSH